MKAKEFEVDIFKVTAETFDAVALSLFRFQYENNKLYGQFCDLLKRTPEVVGLRNEIPFLPISFFKSHDLKTTGFKPQIIFKSSGTTGMLQSRHLIRKTDIYQKSFITTFEMFYGKPADYCIAALLPSYVAQEHSSLVYMVQALQGENAKPGSGFYLEDGKDLQRLLTKNESEGIHTFLIGVTYALLDFAADFPMQLRHCTVMETGGMKGRKKEITRTEVHDFLKKQLGVAVIHSEYGMTELLSQAYSKGNGIFNCAPWMQVAIRSEDDPFHVTFSEAQSNHTITGIVNVIDLANIYSCAFIATDDTGRLFEDGSFEITGRLDNSDLRGCSLLSF